MNENAKDVFVQQCSEDPCDMKRREVECSVPGGSCAEALKPPEERQCGNIVCGTWNAGNWSEVSSYIPVGIPRPQFHPNSASIPPQFFSDSAPILFRFCWLNFIPIVTSN